jgi:hypothetical protein
MSNQTRITKEELEICRRSPLYHYNTYVRKPDQPLLTQQQFDDMRKPKIDYNPITRKKADRKAKEQFELIDDEIS